MLNCNPLTTPMQTCIQLSKEKSLTSTEDQYPYLQMVGNLMHAIVNSLLDCANIVSSLAQYLSSLAPSHIQTLKRTMRYIKVPLPLELSTKHPLKEIFCIVIPMPIGKETKTHGIPPPDVASYLVAISFLGVARKNNQLHSALHNQNTWH